MAEDLTGLIRELSGRMDSQEALQLQHQQARERGEQLQRELRQEVERMRADYDAHFESLGNLTEHMARGLTKAIMAFEDRVKCQSTQLREHVDCVLKANRESLAEMVSRDLEQVPLQEATQGLQSGTGNSSASGTVKIRAEASEQTKVLAAQIESQHRWFSESLTTFSKQLLDMQLSLSKLESQISPGTDNAEIAERMRRIAASVHASLGTLADSDSDCKPLVASALQQTAAQPPQGGACRQTSAPQAAASIQTVDNAEVAGKTLQRSRTSPCVGLRGLNKEFSQKLDTVKEAVVLEEEPPYEVRSRSNQWPVRHEDQGTKQNPAVNGKLWARTRSHSPHEIMSQPCDSNAVQKPSWIGPAFDNRYARAPSGVRMPASPVASPVVSMRGSVSASTSFGGPCVQQRRYVANLRSL
eukprot:TRINITY_DN3792_c0_g1_i2.p1 TRINITY_DN3792_c0_g1~~TRINITY_DN3792_c0_g1_i2.p1  ORF type:complete len:414 (+),score=82.35 TRINITY_DN3792_c0_g1_i2:65-1306(+)